MRGDQSEDRGIPGSSGVRWTGLSNDRSLGFGAIGLAAILKRAESVEETGSSMVGILNSGEI
jgi:hypothetical protein